MKKKTIIGALIALCSVFIVCIIVGFTVMANQVNDDIICNGVFIDTIDVSGMSEEEASEAVDEYINKLSQKTITLEVDDKEISSTLEELGFESIENNHVNDAMMVGKSGNLIKRYKELKNIEKENLVYELEFQFDDTKLSEFAAQCEEYNVPAQNATITRQNGAFVITDSTIGRKVVTDETLGKLKNSVSKEWNREDVILEAVVIDDLPQYSREDLEKINTPLGKFSTSFATSSFNRSTNLDTGAKHIDGTVLYPGEEFSTYEKLAPFTVDNGYREAAAYSNGKVVDDNIGGGICQVSSTLYNAVLNAELEVTERSPHSMSVSYVPLSMDAAIAGTYKDFKFKNNLDIPIYIEGYTSGKVIYFTIWGSEYRPDNRIVKYESVTTSKKEPPKDVITEDETQPTSYKKVDQSAHYGYTAELYKIVYENGTEVSRTKVNSSSYKASPNYITVGTKEEEVEEPEDGEEGEDGKGEDDEKKPASNTKPNKPKPSTKPTQKPEEPSELEEPIFPEEPIE